MKAPSTYSIIVTYNGEKWISTCLNSLCSSTVFNKVIIVDNGSSDSTLSIIKKDFSDAIIIENKENLGFGKANNIGITYALKNGADFVFLLNQDAFIEEKALEHLINCAKLNPAYGILSPIHLNWEGAKLENYFARFVASNKNFYSDYVLKNQLKQLYHVPFINAAAWLLPRRSLLQVGGFDPVFRHYGEDNNYCQRIAYHNFKIGIAPNATVFHDSNIRKAAEDYLFTDQYFLDEVKNTQVKYGNINEYFSNKKINNHRNQILKLIIINLLKLKMKYVRGYLKKYFIYGKVIPKIIHSRKLNKVKGAHYLNL